LPEKDLAIGIDLGGTQLRAAVVNRAGGIVCRAAVPTDVPGGPKSIVGQMMQLCDRIGVDRHQQRISGVGVSAPGPLDSESGTIIAIPTLPGWEEFPLATTLARELGLPVVAENDGIAAANGEWKFGSARELRHFVYVTVSTGIGGGVVVDGRLLHGRRGLACHVGHMVIAPDGPLCSCGARGCFEALASGSALRRAGREALAAEPASALAREYQSGAITARDIVDAARKRDRLALALLEREASWLGIGFADLAHLYSPQAIVMGGGVSQAFDLFHPKIAAAFCASAMPPFRDVRIVAAICGDNAGLAGAAALAREMKGQTG
jgi:glucokinase